MRNKQLFALTGEFTPEMSQKIQQEQEKLFNQDPWKVKAA
jgi:hypothetical protein